MNNFRTESDSLCGSLVTLNALSLRLNAVVSF